MKVLTLLPFILPGILAAPTAEEQTLLSDVIGYSDLTGGIFGEFVKAVEHIIHSGEEVVEKNVEQWFEDGKEFVKQNGLVCESAQNEASRTCNSYLELLRRTGLAPFVF
jgi:hypothetical protein